MDNVLVANPANVWVVEPRFHSEHVPWLELGILEAWRFVEFEAEAVSGSVEKTDPAVVALFCRESFLVKEAKDVLVDGGAGGAGVKLGDCVFLGFEASLPKGALGFGGGATDNGAGEVAIIAGLRVAWEYVEND